MSGVGRPTIMYGMLLNLEDEWDKLEHPEKQG